MLAMHKRATAARMPRAATIDAEPIAYGRSLALDDYLVDLESPRWALVKEACKVREYCLAPHDRFATRLMVDAVECKERRGPMRVVGLPRADKLFDQFR
jgi:hypothetical protein